MIPSTRGVGVARPIQLQCRLASSSTRAAGRGPRPGPKQQPPPPLRISPTYKPRPATPKASNRPDAKQPDTLLNVWRSSWLPLSGAAVVAGFLGFYVFGTATASLRGPCACEDHDANATPTGRPPALTGDNAEQFDKELNLPEWWMGITSLRRTIASRATGHVLELAMGSGRNLEYYNWDLLSAAASSSSTPTYGITSFTGLDISPDMLDVARRKLVKAVPPMKKSAPIVHASTMPDRTGGQLSYLDDHLRLVTSDAHKPLPPPSRTDRYDTIIQTFGLCSVSDPVGVLTNLASVLRPETGRIILLEHGRSWLGIVNGLLDRNAHKHFAKYGCWWNRDIQELVEKAAAKTPGLEIVRVDRPNILQMGTLVRVELRVKE